MAEFKAAAIFSRNMVLQREKPVLIFGKGEENALITAYIDGIKASGRVKDGKWSVQLPPHKAGTGYSLTLSCGEDILTFDNVAYGEVWLAGGQSNMELELQNCREKDALTKDKTPNVRFYYTPKKNIREKDFFECENNTCWSEFDGEAAKCWSAVGYFFA
ncbi:MAG: sialate O-acetylesterase, partial [Ruminiclostridium sp.]|nr:sialate O-acetylesterase [Ruminiclostridium sp.]